MRKIIAYILIGLISGVSIYHFWPKTELNQEILPSTKQQIITKSENLILQESSFQKLSGWDNADLRVSLNAFKQSCNFILKQDLEKPIGSKEIAIKAKDLRPACLAANSQEEYSKSDAKAFFEKWFMPMTIKQNKEDVQPEDGLFTGYYMPSIDASSTKSSIYSVPIYGVPNDLISVALGKFDASLSHHRLLFGRLLAKKLIPYYSHAEILKGAIQNKAPVLAWIKSAVDREFLSIEGSGVLTFPDGSQKFVGYAAENGAKFTPVGKILINKGVLTKDTASMQAIRAYFNKNPNKVNTLLPQNKSFVFFENLKQNSAIGVQGIPLTPGYSMAVDKKWIPIGLPIWLNTAKSQLQRLMVSQDTGGAIRGPVRGDVYWGSDKHAIFMAGNMKEKGNYWLFLPRAIT